MDNNSTKVSQELQRELAEYGIVRHKVEEKAAPNSERPKFFGIKEAGSKTELKFNTTIKGIQDAKMTVAIAAPEHESFNMLVTTNFSKAVTTASEEDLRTFIRKIVDKA